MDREPIYSTDYISLWPDGEIGVDDGVGYIDSIGKKDAIEFVKKAYEYFKSTGDINA